MKDRITLLIKAKNLTAAQFADEIGVQKSSISHILSGRNNASLDFIQKILVSYPDVNMEWLMFGKGPIFKSAETSLNPSSDGRLGSFQPQVSASVDLFSELIPAKGTEYARENELKTDTVLEEKNEQFEKEIPVLKPIEENRTGIITTPEIQPEEKPVYPGPKQSTTKTILKIVEFYSDNTYREFYPE
ncbi:MAG: helix-turn-helix transcriptional regulator [Bacteroidales bacterium]